VQEFHRLNGLHRLDADYNQACLAFHFQYNPKLPNEIPKVQGKLLNLRLLREQVSKQQCSLSKVTAQFNSS
jgi:hypothetical protein